LILVDTSVWVDFFNSPRSAAGAELERLIRANSPVVLAGVVVTEVLQGLRYDIEPVRRILARQPLLEPHGFVTYEAAAGIFREAKARGVTLSTIDALLAALTLEYDATLFTMDQDFTRLSFTGLLLHGSNRRK